MVITALFGELVARYNLLNACYLVIHIDFIFEQQFYDQEHSEASTKWSKLLNKYIFESILLT